MKFRHLLITTVVLCLCLHVTSLGLSAQSAQAVQKIEQIAKDLKLTPQQKAQLVPILRAEVPELEAIKSDSSLTGAQKVEKFRALHAKTAPQVQSILNSQQYQKLQQIREKEIVQIITKKLGQ